MSKIDYFEVEIDGKRIQLDYDPAEVSKGMYFVMAITDLPQESLPCVAHKSYYQPKDAGVQSAWFYWFSASEIHSIEIQPLADPELCRLTMMSKQGKIVAETVHIFLKCISFGSQFDIYEIEALNPTTSYKLLRVLSYTTELV